MLACYEAGKPLVYDAFNVHELIGTGKVAEREVLRLLDEHRFALVQLDMGEANEKPTDVHGHHLFSEAFMTHLLDDYQFIGQVYKFAVYAPKGL
jgi:hypothetical protein